MRSENWDLLVVVKHENGLLTGVSFVPSHTTSNPISVGIMQIPPFFNISVSKVIYLTEEGYNKPMSRARSF